MKIVDEACAMQYLSSLPESWVYIKNLSRIEEERQVEQVTTYTKFKVRSVDIERQTILIYGTEDIDRLVIDKNLIASYQMTPVMDELYIPIVTDNNSIDIYIKKYIPNIRNRFVEILQSTQNLIITEGKTDWKHLKRALSYFQSNGIYKDINGKIYAVKPMCTHLGCLLSWNDLDKTWDCPCHGSRFNYDGKNLYDPALKDLEIFNVTC